ncbi:MAG: prepilin peptidase [Roseiflexaceae bacterium]|nr:prepilin peptidase [Roseiflexaceae bacterium]
MDLGLIVTLFVGLLLGGLMNIVIVRLPREQNMGGWPHCTRCGRKLAWWQMLPLVGWLAQRGHASCCGKPLHWVYPLVELLSGIMVAWLYSRYGLSPLFFYLTFVTIILLITGAIDWLHRWIYTFVILGSAIVVLIASAFVRPHTLLNAFAGLLIAGFIFLLFYILARFLFPSQSAPFGLGDVYLAMFLGAAFGLTRLATMLFIGMLLAGIFSVGVIARRSSGRPSPQYISYGTFLCLGAITYIAVYGM